MNNWTNVNEQLPDIGKPVLAIDKWGYMAVCGWSGNGWYPCLDGQYPNFISDSYTHWQPLPTPPQS